MHNGCIGPEALIVDSEDEDVSVFVEKVDGELPTLDEVGVELSVSGVEAVLGLVEADGDAEEVELVAVPLEGDVDEVEEVGAVPVGLSVEGFAVLVELEVEELSLVVSVEVLPVGAVAVPLFLESKSPALPLASAEPVPGLSQPDVG